MTFTGASSILRNHSGTTGAIFLGAFSSSFEFEGDLGTGADNNVPFDLQVGAKTYDFALALQAACNAAGCTCYGTGCTPP